MVIKENIITLMKFWFIALILGSLRVMYVIYVKNNDIGIIPVELIAFVPMLGLVWFYKKKLKPQTQFWVFYNAVLIHVFLRVLVYLVDFPMEMRLSYCTSL